MGAGPPKAHCLLSLESALLGCRDSRISCLLLQEISNPLKERRFQNGGIFLKLIIETYQHSYRYNRAHRLHERRLADWKSQESQRRRARRPERRLVGALPPDLGHLCPLHPQPGRAARAAGDAVRALRRELRRDRQWLLAGHGYFLGRGHLHSLHGGLGVRLHHVCAEHHEEKYFQRLRAAARNRRTVPYSGFDTLPCWLGLPEGHRLLWTLCIGLQTRRLLLGLGLLHRHRRHSPHLHLCCLLRTSRNCNLQ
ncbi:LHFPL tetraspan subfamily member 2 protein isoform X2 [Lynx canadensis]|uniref:LHFPL tetraspan subfamily member 2 protein isoform X2 n=1 Tax=Lynx canadensis TaxID=61383 RepID=UPI0013C4C058|nr:LHFPL tetraspan subfamily member 2 protein isoform X2 [Lynx canadensis]